MQITEADVVMWLTEKVRSELGTAFGMGVLEQTVDKATVECRRQALQTLVQETATLHPLVCPRCGRDLNVEAYGRTRCVNSSVGPVQFRRDYGFCVCCGEHAYPADVALGLHPRATGSPRVQELCALNALRGPTGQHGEDLRR